MSDDNWAHRSQEMKCGTCMWFVVKVAPVWAEADGGKPIGDIQPGKVYAASPDSIQQINSERVGRCRRHAPTMNGYPVVFRNDWCGDHKLDETKVSP